MNSSQPTLFMRGATFVAISATTTLVVPGAGAHHAEAHGEPSPLSSRSAIAWSQQAPTPILMPNPSPTLQSAPPEATPTGTHVSDETSNGCQVTATSSKAVARLIGLLNRHRAAEGARPLMLNASLSDVARTHSCDMFLHQQLNHDGSDGSTPFERMGAAGFTLPPYNQEGENVGMTGGRLAPAAIVLLDGMMMAEPPAHGNHRWNIVNGGYSLVGLGVIAANGQTWLTEDFAG